MEHNRPSKVRSDLLSFQPDTQNFETASTSSSLTVFDYLLNYQPLAQKRVHIHDPQWPLLSEVGQPTPIPEISNFEIHNKTQAQDTNLHPTSPKAKIQPYSENLVDMFTAGYNAATTSANVIGTGPASVDPLTLFQSIREVVQPYIVERNKEVERSYELLRLGQENKVTFKDVVEIAKVMKEYFVDAPKQIEIELARLKSDNDRKYMELKLQVQKMTAKREINTVKNKVLDDILSLVKNILESIVQNQKNMDPLEPQGNQDQNDIAVTEPIVMMRVRKGKTEASKEVSEEKPGLVVEASVG